MTFGRSRAGGAKDDVLVIGLGRFGSALARELEAIGHEVLAVDSNESIVNDLAPEVTHALQLDATDEDALAAAGAAEFGTAIVAISSDTQASIFATMALKRLGVKTVIAKAGSDLHGAILERVGADRVVYPEREMGVQVAHTHSIPNVIEYLNVAPNFGVEKIVPPASFIGRTLAELDLPRQLGLTPIALRRGDRVTVNPHPSERVGDGDELVLIGPDDRLERLRE
jgi:trk system potassium uptake protein TrkA